MKSILPVTWMIVLALPFAISHANSKIAARLQSSTDSSGPSNEDIDGSEGWTSIIPPNRTGQSFIAKSRTLSSIEVALLTTGNRTEGKEIVTMKILSEDGRTLTRVSRSIGVGFNGWLRLELRGKGLKVVPGQKLVIRLEDTGKVLFGWKYSSDKYSDGTAIMLGKEDKRYDFLFRVHH